MKCPICGKEIANGSMFCEYCGAQVKKNRKPLLITIFVIIVLLALGGFGYYQYDKAKQEREAMEREMAEAQQQLQQAQQQLQQAQQKQQENNNKMLNDKESYLVLVKDGDALLADKKYSESISKYNDALVYEQKYSGTGYASHFNSNVETKISLAKQQQKQQEEYARTTGHDWVDLGLSVKWATCNVGANKPEDYGTYYAWGETSTKTEYTEDNSKTYGKLEGYEIGDIKGNSNYDAARANWGGNWRMPTRSELQELIDKCTWTWTTQNGVNGYNVKGPNGNSIFLPAAGVRIGSSLSDAVFYVYYWSSTPRSNYFDDGGYSAYGLGFDSGSHNAYSYRRYYGFSVRPVLE